MANQPEVINYDVGVYQLEITDPVDGGAGAVSNAPLLNLANRTAWLKKHVDDLESGNFKMDWAAPKNSPIFTGTPVAPTPSLGDNSSKIATTAFVQLTVSGSLTKNVAGGVNVSLTQDEAGAGSLIFIGLLTANIAVIVPSVNKCWTVSNQTTGPFTLTVKTAAGSGVTVAQGKNREIWSDGVGVLESTNDFTDAALTGAPTAPTAASGDMSTKVASTGFVFNATDGMSVVNVAGSSNVTPSPLQYGCAIMRLTGALTANISLILPSQSGQWVLDNQSSGGFNITARTAAGVGVILPSGLAVVVYSDGVNVAFASSSAAKSFKVSPFSPPAGTTALTIVGGYTVGNVIVEKSGAMSQQDEFVASDGATVWVTPTNAGDKLTVYSFSTFEVANAVKKSGDVMSGPLIGPPSATEGNAGLIALSTTAQAQALADNTAAITPLKLGQVIALESRQGLVQLATTAQAQALLNDTAAITPLKLARAFEGNSSLGTSGYQKLPSGLIIQWGTTVSVASGSFVGVNFPITFPTAGVQMFATVTTAAALTESYSCATEIFSPAIGRVYHFGSTGQPAVYRYFVIGY